MAGLIFHLSSGHSPFRHRSRCQDLFSHVYAAHAQGSVILWFHGSVMVHLPVPCRGRRVSPSQSTSLRGSHWSWITQSGINGDKQSEIKFLLCDKWNCLNCSSYIFHDIYRLVLQQRPEQFALLTAVVAGLVHLFLPLSYQVKTPRSHKPCSTWHSFWKHSHLGLGGVGALTHQGGNLCECVQPICKNCKGVLMSSVTEMLIFLKIKFHFMSCLRHLDL